MAIEVKLENKGDWKGEGVGIAVGYGGKYTQDVVYTQMKMASFNPVDIF